MRIAGALIFALLALHSRDTILIALTIGAAIGFAVGALRKGD